MASAALHLTARGPMPRRYTGGTESHLRCAMPEKTQLRVQAAGELACRPGSVRPLSRADGHPSRTAVAGSLMRSTREHRAGRPRSLAQACRFRGTALLTLLQMGFTEPPQSPAALVVSYTTVSPLPPDRSPAAVCFLWHFPAGHPGSALPTTLPCGARTFLVDAGEPESTRPPGQLTRRSPILGRRASSRSVRGPMTRYGCAIHRVLRLSMTLSHTPAAILASEPAAAALFEVGRVVQRAQQRRAVLEVVDPRQRRHVEVHPEHSFRRSE